MPATLKLTTWYAKRVTKNGFHLNHYFYSRKENRPNIIAFLSNYSLSLKQYLPQIPWSHFHVE